MLYVLRTDLSNENPILLEYNEGDESGCSD
jgi:hypothetical protein